MPGKTMVVFKGAYFYADCDDPFSNFIATYNMFTKQVTAIKVYGINMRNALKYFQEHPFIFGCNIYHYMNDVYCSAPSITFLVS